MTDVVRAQVDVLAQFIADNIGVDPPTYDNMVDLIRTFIQTQGNIDIPLSSVSVDYETNKAEMDSILVKYQTWLDNTEVGTGQTLKEMIATALTYEQFAIVRAAQETMIPTAVQDNSIYAGALFLGVRLSRRIPAKIPVSLSRSGPTTSSLELDPYSQFISSGVNLFNREAVIFPIGTTTISVDLYEGRTLTTEFISDGSNYQLYEIGASDYSVSDIDTTVTVNNIAWTRTAFEKYFNIGLWEYDSVAQVYEEDTTADGNVELVFGNGINGAIPSAGATIVAKFVSTSGQSGNIDITGQTIVCSDSNLISGTVSGTGRDGTNPRSAQEIKALAPALFFAKYRAIERAGHRAIANKYPGVIDSMFEGQQEIAPADLRYMMYQRATILANTNWGTTVYPYSTQWQNFIAWFINLGIANIQIIPRNPDTITLNISAEVYCKSTITSLAAVQNLISARIRAEFVPRIGILGYGRYNSDIEGIIKDADPAIDYSVVTAADTPAAPYEYVILGSLTLNMHYSQRGNLA